MTQAISLWLIFKQADPQRISSPPASKADGSAVTWGQCAVRPTFASALFRSGLIKLCLQIAAQSQLNGLTYVWVYEIEDLTALTGVVRNKLLVTIGYS